MELIVLGCQADTLGTNCNKLLWGGSCFSFSRCNTYPSRHFSALHSLHCEMFCRLLLKGLIFKKSCKQAEDYIEICVQAVSVKASNMTVICCEFSAVKKISGVSTVNCSKWQHSNQRSQKFCVILRQYTPLITESAIAFCTTLFSICTL